MDSVLSPESNTYGPLHLPSYRGMFANNVIKELPLAREQADFEAMEEAGQRLIDIRVKFDRVEH